MGNGKYVTLVPFAENGGRQREQPDRQCNLGLPAHGSDRRLYVDTLDETSGKFRVNFEDVEQGADHDMDAIAIYEYKVNGDNVDVTVTSEYAAGSLIQHMGYVDLGYAERRHVLRRPRYRHERGQRSGLLSRHSGHWHWDDKKALPLTNKRTFTVGTTPSAKLLKDPLWYAAKWGGFKDENKDGYPSDANGDKPSEWDEDKDGDPDNYFLVTNALTLGAQLTKAFNEIRARIDVGLVRVGELRLDLEQDSRVSGAVQQRRLVGQALLLPRRLPERGRHGRLYRPGRVECGGENARSQLARDHHRE